MNKYINRATLTENQEKIWSVAIFLYFFGFIYFWFRLPNLRVIHTTFVAGILFGFLLNDVSLVIWNVVSERFQR